MKSKNIIITTVIVLAAAAFYGVTVYEQMQQMASIRVATDGSQLSVTPEVGAGGGQSDNLSNDQKNDIPQGSDPCGGTGGNGQILSKGNYSFTMKLNRDGRLLKKGSSQIVDLTSQTTIRTATGSGVISDLATGDNVTVGGKPNPDGSFTAMIVAVCKGN